MNQLIKWEHHKMTGCNLMVALKRNPEILYSFLVVYSLLKKCYLCLSFNEKNFYGVHNLKMNLNLHADPSKLIGKPWKPHYFIRTAICMLMSINHVLLRTQMWRMASQPDNDSEPVCWAEQSFLQPRQGTLHDNKCSWIAANEILS